MTQSLWKKLFIGTAVLLLILLSIGGILWRQLNGVTTELNATRIQLNDTVTRLDAIKTEMESLKDQQNWLPGDYDKLREQINLRLGIGQNSQYFITPDDPEISARVQEITVDYDENELWRNYGLMFQWVMGNIKYSADSPIPLLPETTNGTLGWANDFWRFPVETIRDGTGDCEDTALLLASMLLNYNERKFPVWIIGIRTFGPEAKAHMAVAIPIEDNQLSIFDTAGRYHSPFEDLGGYGSQDVPLAMDHWGNHLETRFEKGLAGAQVYVVFSENFYQEFSSTLEFTEWARGLLT